MVLSVIIVHYRVPLYLEQCVYSLEEALSGIEAEIIVINNHSNTLQSSLPIIRERAVVRWIDSGGNIGFAAACNLGWKQAHGKYILFLNPDTLITAHSIKTCMQQLMQNDTIGAVGCRLVNGKGNFLPESKRSLPSLFSAGCKLIGLSALFPRSRLFNQYAMGHVDSHDSCAVEVLTGAFLLIPRNVLEKIDGFDEAFFLYGEDIDCCRRVGSAGYTCWYEGTTSIIHFKGASSRRRGSNYFTHFYRAMIVYCNKYYAFPLKNILQAAIFIRQQLHQSWSFLCQAISPLPSFYPDHVRWLLVSKEYESRQLIRPLRASSEESLQIEEIDWENWLLQTKNTNYNYPTQPTAVVFCIGKLSLNDLVSWIEQNPTDSACYYWHVNSGGMVSPEIALSLSIE